MKAIILKKTGGPNVLNVTEVPTPVPNKNEVLIKVKYIGVNYADILTRKGLYSWAPKRPNILGLEVTGTIIELGSEVHNLSIGDRVFAGMQKGAYAEFVCVDEKQARKVPEFYNWEEAGSFGAQWFTSWIALFETARVRKGEILLVHSAAGGAGSAAVVLGKQFGLEVFGTCSPHKKSIVEAMGATYLSYESFDQTLISLNKRPNCILETVGGDVYRRSLELLAPLGRIICIGASGIKVNKFNPISLYKSYRAIPKATLSQVLRFSRGFMGLHVGYLLNYSNIIEPMWNDMIDYIEKHKLRPIYRKDQIFPLSKAGIAHEYMDKRKNIGKILLDPTL